MKELQFTDEEFNYLEKALIGYVTHKRRAAKNLERNENPKYGSFEKSVTEGEALYERLLEIMPDKYAFGKRND